MKGQAAPLLCAFVTALVLAFSSTGSYSAYASAKSTHSSRDPRQLSVIVSDFDGTFARVGNYKLRLAPYPGMAGLGFYSGLPETVDVPIEDFEGNTGPRIKDLLGRMDQGKFVQSAAIDEVTLSNGQKLRPGYYYPNPSLHP